VCLTVEGKAVPLQAWSDAEGSRKFDKDDATHSPLGTLFPQLTVKGLHTST